MEWDRAAEDLTWDRVIKLLNYALIDTQNSSEFYLNRSFTPLINFAPFEDWH